MFEIRAEKLSDALKEQIDRARELLSFEIRKLINVPIKGRVTKVYSDRRYDVQIPGRAEPYERVPTSPPGTLLRKGQAVVLGFVQGNSGIPVILCTKSVLGPRKYLGPVRKLLEVLYSQWACEFANFQRSNSWTDDDPFVLDNLVKATNPLGGKFSRFFANYRFGYNPTLGIAYVPIDPSDPAHYPRVEWELDGEDVATVLGLAEGGDYYNWYEGEVGTPEEGYTRSHAISQSEVLHHCLSGELVYLELQVVVDSTVTPEGGDPELDGSLEDSVFRRVLVALYANPPEHGFALTMAWGLDLTALYPTNERMAGTDILVTAGRVAIVYDGPYLLHVDESGGDLQELDLSPIAIGNGSSLVADCISNRWLQTFTISKTDPRVFLATPSIALSCINLSTNSIQWTRTEETTTWGISGLASTYEGQSLMAWRVTEVFEIVVDYLMDRGTVGSTFGEGEPGWYTWPETPTTYSAPRETPTLAPGHSIKLEFVAVSLDTGLDVGTDDTFETEANGTADAGFEQYAITVDLPSLSDPPSFENDDPDPDNPFNDWLFFPSDDFSATFQNVRHLQLSDYFNGTARDPYNNVTGTAIEGPSSPGVTGSFPSVLPPSTSVQELLDYSDSSFFIVLSLDSYTDETEEEAFDAWKEAWIDIVNASASSPSGAPSDNVPGFQAAAAEVELARRNPTDWAIGEVYWQQRESSAIRDEATGALASSATLTVVSRVYYSQRFSGETQDGYIKPLSPWAFVNAIPQDSEKPAFGSRKSFGAQYRISLEYAAAHEAWDGVSVRPYDGQVGDLISAGTGGGGTTNFKHRIFFQTDPEGLPRTKSVAPKFLLGGSCSTGKYLVCGPRYIAGEGLHWRAYNGFAGIAWEQHLDKPGAVPAIPVALRIPDGRVGVFTPYEYSGGRWLCVLDAEDGSVIYDEEMPETITSTLLESYYGDRTIWALSPTSTMALTEGEE